MDAISPTQDSRRTNPGVRLAVVEDDAGFRQRLVELIQGQSPVMSPPVAQRLWQLARDAEPKASRALYRLSPREWEVLVLAARGRQHGEISRELGIAMDTVKNHFRRIYEKTGAHSPIDVLVRFKEGRGLLDDAPHDP